MCGLFDTPKAPQPKTEKPAPFIFQNSDTKAAKAKKKGISALTVDLNTGSSGSGDATGLTIPS